MLVSNARIGRGSRVFLKSVFPTGPLSRRVEALDLPREIFLISRRYLRDDNEISRTFLRGIKVLGGTDDAAVPVG